MPNNVCGIITAINNDSIDVSVNRKTACDGCHAVDVCHSMSSNEMDFTFSKPDEPVKIGDRVTIAIDESSFLKACSYTFGIPLLSIIIAIALLQLLGLSAAIQATGGIAAAALSLLLVRHLGKGIRAPRIVEIKHD